MNGTVVSVKSLTPTWNETRHKFLLVLITFGIISNIILLVITFITKNLIRRSLQHSTSATSKYNKLIRNLADRSQSNKNTFPAFFLSKCCVTSNDDDQIITPPSSAYSCCEFEVNWGCCIYKTECQSRCFTKSSNRSPVATNIELERLKNYSNSDIDGNSVNVIEDSPKKIQKNPTICINNYSMTKTLADQCESSSISRNSTRQSLKCDHLYTEVHKSSEYTNSNSSIAMTGPPTNFRSLSTSPPASPPKIITENNSCTLEHTNWHIFRFLTQILAFAQIGYLIFENLLPWISNLLILYLGFGLKLKLNINCRLKRMFGAFFLLFEEWSLLLFGIERVCKVLFSVHSVNRSCHPANLCLIEHNRCKLHSLCLKISTGLFIALIFAALCNYLWVFGQFHWINTVKYVDSTKNITQVETVSCDVRSEYFRFYYTFLIYMDPLFTFIIPHLCCISFSIIILLHCCLRPFCRRPQTPTNTNTPNTAMGSNSVDGAPVQMMLRSNLNRVYNLIDYMSTTVFLIDCLLIVTLKFWRNIEKTMMVFFRITLDTNYFMIRNELYHLVFCLVPITTISIYVVFYYKIKKCLRSRRRSLDI
ncbi:unnamed protein product [Trichobilharzia szidati]|nr:unnamed protein product [Trichobilharzia szidati]CAH8867432.1 unnamed protein product [Trichobilharzia szidati]